MYPVVVVHLRSDSQDLFCDSLMTGVTDHATIAHHNPKVIQYTDTSMYSMQYKYNICSLNGKGDHTPN